MGRSGGGAARLVWSLGMVLVFLTDPSLQACTIEPCDVMSGPSTDQTEPAWGMFGMFAPPVGGTGDQTGIQPPTLPTITGSVNVSLGSASALFGGSLTGMSNTASGQTTTARSTAVSDYGGNSNETDTDAAASAGSLFFGGTGTSAGSEKTGWGDFVGSFNTGGGATNDPSTDPGAGDAAVGPVQPGGGRETTTAAQKLFSIYETIPAGGSSKTTTTTTTTTATSPTSLFNETTTGRKVTDKEVLPDDGDRDVGVGGPLGGGGSDPLPGGDPLPSPGNVVDPAGDGSLLHGSDTGVGSPLDSGSGSGPQDASRPGTAPDSSWWSGDDQSKKAPDSANTTDDTLLNELQIVFFLAPCFGALLAVAGIISVVCYATARRRQRKRLLAQLKKQRKEEEKRLKQQQKDREAASKEQQVKQEDETQEQREKRHKKKKKHKKHHRHHNPHHPPNPYPHPPPPQPYQHPPYAFPPEHYNDAYAAYYDYDAAGLMTSPRK